MMILPTPRAPAKMNATPMRLAMALADGLDRAALANDLFKPLRAKLASRT